MLISIRQKYSRLIEFSQLHKHFNSYFRVVPALVPELIAEAQMIRHDVYCCELGWEPVQKDGREKDAYDQQSLHCLLKGVRNHRYVGCVRLVRPVGDGVSGKLPFQETCGDTLMPGHPDPDAVARGEVAEISRLAIIAECRRRKNEQDRPFVIADGDFGFHEQRKFPYIPVGLYIGMLHMASYYGIKNLYFLTEPMLAIHFSRLGGKLVPVGEAIMHRGKRRPYMMNVQEVLKGANMLLRPLIWSIGRDVKAQLRDLEKISLPTAGFVKKRVAGNFS